jgi:hypothetical protein
MTPGPWRLAAASALSTSHEKLGTPCQDAHACQALLAATGETLLVAVVADGAGSAVRSGEGAQLACALMLDEAWALCQFGGDTGSGIGGLSRELACDWLVLRPRSSFRVCMLDIA